jgi:hypothetical protein
LKKKNFKDETVGQLPAEIPLWSMSDGSEDFKMREISSFARN